MHYTTQRSTVHHSTEGCSAEQWNEVQFRNALQHNAAHIAVQCSEVHSQVHSQVRCSAQDGDR